MNHKMIIQNFAKICSRYSTLHAGMYNRLLISKNSSYDITPLNFQEVEEKTKSLEILEEEKSKTIDKLHQYKERMINMKNRIDELERENSDLNKKYDEEVKQRNGKFLKNQGSDSE